MVAGRAGSRSRNPRSCCCSSACLRTGGPLPRAPLLRAGRQRWTDQGACALRTDRLARHGPARHRDGRLTAGRRVPVRLMTSGRVSGSPSRLSARVPQEDLTGSRAVRGGGSSGRRRPAPVQGACARRFPSGQRVRRRLSETMRVRSSNTGRRASFGDQVAIDFVLRRHSSGRSAASISSFARQCRPLRPSSSPRL